MKEGMMMTMMVKMKMVYMHIQHVVCFNLLIYFTMLTGHVDDDSRSRTPKSRKSVSDFDETSGSSARRRVGGARDRRVYGDLSEATVGCQEGLVCTPVDVGRSECRPENTNGTYMT